MQSQSKRTSAPASDSIGGRPDCPPTATRGGIRPGTPRRSAAGWNRRNAGALLMMDPTNAIAIDHRSTSKAVTGESK